MKITQYRKFLVALAAALAVAATGLDDGGVSSSEWIEIGLAFAGALGVWAIPNAALDPTYKA